MLFYLQLQVTGMVSGHYSYPRDSGYSTDRMIGCIFHPRSSRHFPRVTAGADMKSNCEEGTSWHKQLIQLARLRGGSGGYLAPPTGNVGVHGVCLPSLRLRQRWATNPEADELRWWQLLRMVTDTFWRKKRKTALLLSYGSSSSLPIHHSLLLSLIP